MGTNRDRAEGAATSLDEYQIINGCCEDEVLAFLLSDLMHWANQTSYDFDAELARAKPQKDEEIEEDEDC